MLNFIGKMGGRKFLVALVALAAVVLNATLGISEQSVLIGGGIAISYILGQSFADGLTGGATSTTANVNDRE